MASSPPWKCESVRDSRRRCFVCISSIGDYDKGYGHEAERGNWITITGRVNVCLFSPGGEGSVWVGR